MSVLIDVPSAQPGSGLPLPGEESLLNDGLDDLDAVDDEQVGHAGSC
jgi:hypothetical protein